MSMSLRRKMALRESAARDAGVARRLAGISRAGQVARTTVPVGESDLPVVETLETVVDTAEVLPGVIEAADQAGSDAYDAAIRVDEAQAVADGAAQDAANALTTASGKNSRRRGVTEPAPPEGGWVQGDQWVRDEDRAGVMTPVQVLVWDGTEFVPEQIIADDILVIGEDGTVRIKDDTVTAGAIAADAIDGMTITGAFIRTAPSGQRWEITATGIVGFDEAGLRGATLTPTTGGRLTLGDGSATRRANMSATSMWFIDEGSARPHQGAYSTDGFWVKEMVGGLAAGKVTHGSAGDVLVESPDSANPGTSFASRIFATESYARLEVSRTAPVVGTSYGSLSMRANGESELRVTRIADTTMGETVFEDGVRFADVGIPGNGQIYRFTDGLRVTDPIGIMLMGKTQTPGNEFTLKSQLNAWAPIDGTHAWVTAEGREYVRAGGAWRALADVASDTAWANVSIPGGTGTCRWRRLAGIIYLEFDVTYTTAVPAGGAKAPGFTLPAAARPAVNTPLTIIGSGSREATGYIEASSGNSAIKNSSTVAKEQFFGSGLWAAAS